MSMNLVLKCSRCKLHKSQDEFGSNAARPNGKNNECAVCKRISSAEYKARNPDKIRAAHKLYYQKNKAVVDAKHAEWRKENPWYFTDYQTLEQYGEVIRDPLAKTKDRFRRARAVGYRSGLEVQIARQLEEAGIMFAYEAIKISYVIPESSHVYTPDHLIVREDGSILIIETKGIFELADRKKHLWIKEQHPELDLRFVFQNANAKLRKGAKSTYGEWCEKNGFLYAHKTIPEEWL